MFNTLLFLIAALICEIAGTLCGFGSSVFFVPVARFFFSFNLVLGITGILHVFSNTSKIFLFYKHVNYRLLFQYGLPSIFFVIGGAYLTTIVSLEWIQLTLGIFLILLSSFLLFFTGIKIPANRTNTFFSGALYSRVQWHWWSHQRNQHGSVWT
jgi:hypothetical protein